MSPNLLASPPKSTAKPSKSSTKPSADPNVLEVVFGSLLIKPWYPSFYPEELVGRTVQRLYVCHLCFKYGKELMGFLGHLKVCERRGGDSGVDSTVPANCVYKSGGYSLWEIDGEENKALQLYAQNLSLFAKLFLDTKSVFYDVTTFLYYLLVAENPSPSVSTPFSQPTSQTAANTKVSANLGAHQVVGFFSKEKMSWDNNNLACILVFPPWQKQGLGQILMGASYEISKRERRLGGPEKPLSDLGRRAYLHHWSTTLARAILGVPSRKTLTVLDLRNETYIVPEDIVATLQVMDVLEHRKRGGADIVINKSKVRAWVEKNKADLRSAVDPEGFGREGGVNEEE
ncbi:hypothetical protein CC78DRAFT_479640 [Lojkania enalia]|uniref:histone acetyltransferase n=1 Tax=Lojkania enalia TaxID=147567 RepID=A0A9P4MUQ0_9PLEO|nr:hypothetical protein CC78DRAFT_479640 [Didymosphaeria enalia]